MRIFMLILCYIVVAGMTVWAQEASFNSRLTVDQLQNAPAKLIPYPRQIDWAGDYLSLTAVSLEESEALSPTLRTELTEILEEQGLAIQSAAAPSLSFATDITYAGEAYGLNIAGEAITLTAATEAGHFYALQTLRQLLQTVNGKARLPVCTIEDAPAYPVRGFMIDVGRNFQPLASLKRQLDIMARYKLNVFQWHLTDYPAWRVESKAYPQLTAAENHRPTRNPGQFYTYDDMRELIRYARERHITIIPEIDMPGHSDAFTEAMGFRMETEQGMDALEVILTEFFEEIPHDMAPIIHLGSDEVRVPNPEAFMGRMVRFCRAAGREVMVWDPGLPVDEQVIRQNWRSPPTTDEGYLREVDSWNSYINNGEPMTQVQRLFFKPIGGGSSRQVLGGILCLWPDVKLEDPDDAYVQNPVYPSMLTYAWTSWTADISSAPPTYYMTLPQRDETARAYFAAFEDILLHHKERYFSDLPFPYLRQSDKRWRVIGPFDGDAGDEILRETRESYTIGDTTYRWKSATGNTLVVNDRFRLGGYFPEAKAGQTVYALTYIHSDEERRVDTWIGFETPMRANRTYTGIPENGQWDANGGQIYLNGEPLPGPQWENPGWKPKVQSGWATPEDRERPWTDEELYWTRPPVSLPLKKGWNKVVVSIPASSNYQNWMFTFAPLDTEGLRFAARPQEHSTYYEQRKTHFETLPNTEGEIILLGNSMTDGAEWAELFGNPRVKNRGISGDVTTGVLDRLDEITESKPDRVFLLIGTNDLARDVPAEQVVENIGHIVARINADSPTTEVYVQSIFPVNDHYGLFGGHTSKGDVIRRINRQLERGIEGDYTYLDLHSRFTDRVGKLDLRYSNDGLHLNGAGYRQWADFLRQYVE
jgi:lysophospholipase L1-like esterase